MKQLRYVITDPEGIHARPAALLIKLTTGFSSVITMEKGGKSGDAKRIFAVMGLGVKQGEEVLITAQGPDEDRAIKEIEDFLKENL
ncbi:MAG: HPr family phosphocarrier protein [Lachnospiraceae bacterium]|nr:HPr family phosphocarrier protein [Lachnospiraceae bacterium]